MRRRPWTMALSAAIGLALGACRVEPTPRALLDRRQGAQQEAQEAVTELRTYVLAAVRALDRGDASAAEAVLNPDTPLTVLAPDTTRGAADLRVALRTLRRDAPLVVEQLTVSADVRHGWGWFAARLRDARGRRWHWSGVYRREDGGAWRLAATSLAYGSVSAGDRSDAGTRTTGGGRHH